MRTEGRYGCALDTENRCKVLSMSFDHDINVSLMIAQPDITEWLPDLESKISVEVIHGWIEQLRYKIFRVVLSKFRITGQFDLKEALRSMGISDALMKKSRLQRCYRR